MKNKVEELANFMHLEYERFAQKSGWETNSQCQVEFDKLPKANKKTMLWVAESILERIKKELEDKDKLKIGDIVQHKIIHYEHSDWMMIVRFTDKGDVECRYLNDATKKFTLQVFYEFELKKAKLK